MSYYQKYRPEKIADLDLVSIREAFGVMMKSGEITHAYLFVGPRGSGKTSSARILSRLVNCQRNNPRVEKKRILEEPCGECDACKSIKKGSAVDVMEIDAASHRGIDDIRDLREKANLAPAALPMKVYIIDEVHMLTTEAFNALLKTLEEPPKQVLFILCTTEAHKVPETIISRCVRVNFAKGRKEELVASLRRAAAGEELTIDDAALTTLATGVDGSFREGHKLLEQLAHRYEKITAESVKETLGLVGGNQVEQLLAAVAEGDTKGVIELMKQFEEEGVEVISLVAKLLEQLKSVMRGEVAVGRAPSATLARLARKLIKVVPKVKVSPLPLLPLEMALVGEALRRGRTSKHEEVRPLRPPLRPAEGRMKEKIESPEKHGQAAGRVDFDRVVSGWQELLSRLAPRNHSVAGLLRSSRPKEIKDKFLTIEVFYKFHKEQLEQEARRKIIEEEIAKMWGPISVKCILGEKAVKQMPVVPKEKVSDEDAVKAAEEVFGV